MLRPTADGTTQVLALDVGHSPPLKLGRFFPDPQSEDAWTSELVTLPDDLPQEDNRYIDMVVISGSPDRLLIYRDRSIQEADIGPGGAIGPVTTRITKASSRLVRGQSGVVRPDTRYLLEVGNVSPWSLILRDTTDLSFHPIDPNAFSGFTDFSIFPLRAAGKDRFRAVAADLLSGQVRALTLALDPVSGVFKPTETTNFDPIKRTQGWPPPLTPLYVLEETPGQVRIVVLELPNVRVISGRYDPAKGDAVAWEAPWSTTLPGFPLSPDWDTTASSARYGLTALWNPAAGVLECFFNTANRVTNVGELWSFSLVPGESATEPAPAFVGQGYGNPSIASSLAGDQPTLLLSENCGAFKRFTLATRTESGDYDTTVIAADSEDAAPIETTGYRIGLTLTQDNLPLANQSIGVVASRFARGVAGLRGVTLPTHKPLMLETDETGQAWITIFQDRNLSLPKLRLTSPLFSAPLEIEPDAEIQSFFANVTDDALAKASDPRTGKTVLKSPNFAADTGNAIREALKLAPKIDPSTPGALKVTSTCPFAWQTGPVLPMARPALLPAGAPAWAFDATGGTPRFYTMEHAEAAALIAKLNADHAPIHTAPRPAGVRPMDWLSDAFDWVGDLASTVWDGIVKVTKLVVTGLNMAVTLVLDGVSFVFNGVLDTIERVMDAVAFILDAAGELLGSAVGWLLSQLGFLFDWGALKGKRDAIKQSVRDGFAKAVGSLPDPAVLAKSFGGTIAGAKGTVVDGLNTLRSTPVGTTPMDQTIGSEPSLLSMLMTGSGSTIMPQVTWLLEKIREAIARLFPGPSMLSLPGLDAAFASFGQVADAAGGGVAASLDGVIKLLDSWLLQGSLFSSSALDPVIDLLAGQVSALFDLISSCATAAGDVMHVLWSNPGAIVDWLDTPIRIPFFAGFYKGLTGNAFSMLDAACMAVAVIETAFSSLLPTHPLAMAVSAMGNAGMELPQSAAGFMILNVLAEAFNCFDNAAFPKATLLSTILNLVTSVGAMACAAPIGTYGDSGKALLEELIVSTCAGAVISVLCVSETTRQGARAYAGDFMMMGLALYRLVRLVGDQTATSGTYRGLGLLKSTLACAVRTKVVMSGPVPVVPAAVYAAIQSALTGARTGLFIAEVRSA